MQFADIRGLVIHYRWSDRGAGKPVLVFTNSVGTDLRIWDAVSDMLGESVSILAYDKRGHGLTGLGSPPYGIAEHVEDLAGLLDHLKVRKVIVCGLSVGGLIAQGLALAHPELARGLILCCTAARIGTMDLWNERIRVVEEGGLAAVADGTMTRWFTPHFRTSDNPVLAGARTMFLRQDARGYLGTCAALRDADFTAKLGKVRVPTLCVAGDSDASIPPDLVKALALGIPGSDFAVIDRCGHLPCVEQPVKLTDLIRSFIGKVHVHG